MAVQRVALYDRTLDPSSLYNLRLRFWNQIENFISPAYYTELDDSPIDETGSLIDAYIHVPQGESAPPFVENVYYQDVGGSITPLTHEPTGWSENYQNYYIAAEGFGIFDVDSNQPIFNALGNGCGVFILRDQGVTRYLGVLQSTANQWYAGYITKNGIMIEIRDVDHDENSGIIIIARTNNGDLAVVCKDAKAHRHLCAVDAFVWATTDDVESDDVRFSIVPENAAGKADIHDDQVAQTILCPVPTHSAEGQVSYLRNIFAMPWSQFREETGILHLNDHDYLSNGYYAIMLDEEEGED